MSSKIVISTDLPGAITEDKISTAFKKTLSAIKWSPKGDISIAFVSKDQSQRFNREYAGNDYPTDVLSFSYQETNIIEGEYIGEIVICTEIAESQAKEFGIDLTSEITLLTIHGILHIYGLDHKSEVDKTRFDELQNDIMKSMNLTYRKMPW